MIAKDRIIGKYIELRAVTVEDAQFVLDIRLDANKTKYVHKVSNDLVKQEEWIRNQNLRENDFYYVVMGKDDKPIGLASIYNFKLDSAEFGRWISYGNAFQNVETVILLFDYFFKNFDINVIVADMMEDNKSVINFWKTFGAEHIGLVYERDLTLDKWIVTRNKYFGRIRERSIRLLKYE